MIRQVAHASFVTDQLQEMKRFYSQTLGLPVKFVFKTRDDREFGFFVDCGNFTALEVFDRAAQQNKPSAELEKLVPGNRYAHLCFEVFGLAECKAKLEQQGVKVSEIGTGLSGARMAWINDPDGNLIELTEYTTRSLHIQHLPDGQPLVARRPT